MGLKQGMGNKGNKGVKGHPIIKCSI